MYSILRSSELQHSETVSSSAEPGPISHWTLQLVGLVMGISANSPGPPWALSPGLSFTSLVSSPTMSSHLAQSTWTTLASFPFLYLESLFLPEAYVLVVSLPKTLCSQNLQMATSLRYRGLCSNVTSTGSAFLTNLNSSSIMNPVFLHSTQHHQKLPLNTAFFSIIPQWNICSVSYCNIPAPRTVTGP